GSVVSVERKRRKWARSFLDGHVDDTAVMLAALGIRDLAGLSVGLRVARRDDVANNTPLPFLDLTNLANDQDFNNPSCVVRIIDEPALDGGERNRAFAVFQHTPF